MAAAATTTTATAGKFVIDQTGLIQIMKNGVILPTPFLDITGVIAHLSPAFGAAPTG